MDMVDHAQNLEELHRDLALQNARGALTANVETADNCVDCGMQIPSMRQAALPGVQTCVACAEAAEAEARLHRRRA